MLLALRLRDFVIVDALDIEFSPGFTVLTGETGAGKSILLDALSLAMGGRADAGVVREGAARADISATFRSSEALDAWLAERALAGDPGCVLLRRVIDAEGRSRALVNGNPATAALLRELGEQLVDIHGQHAAQSLLRADGQRRLLDAYAGLADDARALGEAWSAWRTLARDIEAAEGGQRELALERERLAWQAGELERLRLAPGEWDALNEEQKRRLMVLVRPMRGHGMHAMMHRDGPGRHGMRGGPEGRHGDHHMGRHHERGMDRHGERDMDRRGGWRGDDERRGMRGDFSRDDYYRR